MKRSLEGLGLSMGISMISEIFLNDEVVCLAKSMKKIRPGHKL